MRFTPVHDTGTLVLTFATSHIKPHFDEVTQKKILGIVENSAELNRLPVDKFTDLFIKA